jgi:hypothetical protein|uniref:Uncharacterized protein n=1 Tax=viral metagenome TaxID=1070528 RepID=A0A6C0CE48_9ZZZZ
MPTFKAAATAVIAANRLIGHRKKTRNGARRQASSSGSSTGTGNTEKRLEAIECSIKKIELQLKLVDGEIMGNKEFGELKKEIMDCSKPTFSNMDEIMEFLRSADNKRADNRYKYILNVISIVCPLLSACNIGFLKEINPEEISTELIGDAINKTTSYLTTVKQAVNYFIENGDEGAGKIDTLMDLNVLSSDAFDNYREGAEISAVMIGKMSRNVLVLQKELCKYLVIKTKKISNKMNWNILSKTFCICVFYYVLFSKVAGGGSGGSGNASNAVGRFMEVGGGSGSGGSGSGKKKNKRK